jgi:hypothetical protein
VQLSTYVDPIMERLDPQHIIQYRLYRGETYYKDGKHLRDLSKLNRDLSKVVMITTDPAVVSLQSENGVIVSPLLSASHYSSESLFLGGYMSLTTPAENCLHFKSGRISIPSVFQAQININEFFHDLGTSS